MKVGETTVDCTRPYFVEVMHAEKIHTKISYLVLNSLIYLFIAFAKIVKLNRRLQLLEEENKERSKREVILYSATVAFWLINTWIWLRR